jgi:hypothetical protein
VSHGASGRYGDSIDLSGELIKRDATDPAERGFDEASRIDSNINSDASAWTGHDR